MVLFEVSSPQKLYINPSSTTAITTLFPHFSLRQDFEKVNKLSLCLGGGDKRAVEFSNGFLWEGWKFKS